MIWQNKIAAWRTKSDCKRFVNTTMGTDNRGSNLLMDGHEKQRAERDGQNKKSEREQP